MGAPDPNEEAAGGGAGGDAPEQGNARTSSAGGTPAGSLESVDLQWLQSQLQSMLGPGADVSNVSIRDEIEDEVRRARWHRRGEGGNDAAATGAPAARMQHAPPRAYCADALHCRTQDFQHLHTLQKNPFCSKKKLV